MDVKNLFFDVLVEIIVTLLRFTIRSIEFLMNTVCHMADTRASMAFVNASIKISTKTSQNKLRSITPTCTLTFCQSVVLPTRTKCH